MKSTNLYNKRVWYLSSQSHYHLLCKMRFLLALCVLVVGTLAQDTYKCPDGWLLEVCLHFQTNSPDLLCLRKTGAAAGVSWWVLGRRWPRMMPTFSVLSTKLGWLSWITLVSLSFWELLVTTPTVTRYWILVEVCTSGHHRSGRVCCFLAGSNHYCKNTGDLLYI